MTAEQSSERTAPKVNQMSQLRSALQRHADYYLDPAREHESEEQGQIRLALSRLSRGLVQSPALPPSPQENQRKN